MKYIHYKCLKQWIETNSCIKIQKNNTYSIFNIKNFECELCKNKFPDIIEYNGNFLEISNYYFCYEKYIILESLVFDGKKKKFLYVINLENDNSQLKIGRGKDIDILVTDISISRIHCLLVRDKNNVYLNDYNSKFGTLILIQTPILKLSDNLPLYMQVGRTFMQIKIKKPFSLFGCCDISEKNNEYYYHKQNEKEIDYHKNIIIKEENENDDDDIESEISNNDKSNNHGLKVIEFETIDKNNDVQIHVNRVTSVADNIENTETRRNQITEIPIRATIIHEGEK